MKLIFFPFSSKSSSLHRHQLNHRQRALAVAGFILLSLTLVAASCPPQRIAYNSIDTAVDAVQTAVKAFKDLRAQGKFTDADELKVREAYAKFQVSAEAARVLAQNASLKESAMKQINDAAFEAMKVLSAFGVK